MLPEKLINFWKSTNLTATNDDNCDENTNDLST
jgi:hypothetical protein